MAASMPCQDCASGTLHGGTPTGKVIALHGLPTYVTEPPSGTPKGIVVIIPDAFGWELPNTRVLADSYAKKGNFRVYVPEFMDGMYLYTLQTKIRCLIPKIGHSVTPDLLTSMDKVMADEQGILGKMYIGVQQSSIIDI